MKKKSHISSFLVLILIISLISCDGLFDEYLVEPTEDSELQVTTHFPEVRQANVVFKGEVENVSQGERVEYGFMWYISTEDEPLVHRVVLGERTSSSSFSITIDDLPRNEALVVCAYAIDPTPYENEVIGEERDFDWSL